MARQKGFIEENVYEEAKKRIHHIYDTHDNVNIAYSGGKDSTVMLHLAAREARRVGKRLGVLLVDLEGQYKRHV